MLSDLGSHLLDTLNFWFGIQPENFFVVANNSFENRSPDHMIVANNTSIPKIELEMTLLSWRNHFVCDIFAEKGSAHISSLCKWGPSQFIHRVRQLPSGIPHEEAVTLVQPDPTWKLEYSHFKKLCQESVQTNLCIDIWLSRVLKKLEANITREKICYNPSLDLQG
ncbi:MAG: oxidoreductase protein [uncultured bacterium]|nr:MAG: oxidoreductase protein [uncultured bacterium]